MTMRIIDGFDYMAASPNNSALLTRGGWALYNYGGQASATIRRFGFGAAAAPTINNNAGINGASKIFNPINNSQTVFFAGALYRGSSIDSNGGPAIWVGEYSYSCAHLSVRLISHGRVQLFRGNSNGDLRNQNWTLMATSDPDLFDNFTWNWVEVKAYIDDTTGECEVRLNGKTVIHMVSADTRNSSNALIPAYCNMGGFGMGGSNDMTGYIDDFAVWDNLGTTCNTWMGTNRIKTMLVIANGTTVQSTIGGTAPAATNWQSVINAAMDDTKYVYIQDTNVGFYDLYDMDPLVSAPIVHAIQIRVSARQDDATQMVMRTLLKSGATTTEGVSENMAQDYNFWYTKYELNPNTGFAFTQAEANAIEVGYKFQALIP